MRIYSLAVLLLIASVTVAAGTSGNRIRAETFRANFSQTSWLPKFGTNLEPFECSPSVTGETLYICASRLLVGSFSIHVIVRSVANDDINRISLIMANPEQTTGNATAINAVYILAVTKVVELLNPTLTSDARSKLVVKVMKRLRQDSEFRSGAWLYATEARLMVGFFAEPAGPAP